MYELLSSLHMRAPLVCSCSIIIFISELLKLYLTFNKEPATQTPNQINVSLLLCKRPMPNHYHKLINKLGLKESLNLKTSIPNQYRRIIVAGISPFIRTIKQETIFSIFLHIRHGQSKQKQDNQPWCYRHQHTPRMLEFEPRRRL
jgi:hypothetical protein